MRADSLKISNIVCRSANILMHHCELSNEELDFIINYDVKYRMGVSALGEDGDSE